jgi:putative acetyltransferase
MGGGKWFSLRTEAGSPATAGKPLATISIRDEPSPVFLRREGPNDRAEIFAIHAAAFARPDGLVAPEAHLVDGLRDDGDIVPALSIVAESNNELVGHVVCSRATIDSYPSLGLGPLGVLPRHQCRGVGQALMHAVLAAADALDAPAVVLLGDPDYYRRFGFELAEPIGVHPPQPEWTEHFQIRRLNAWTDAMGGVFRYATAFDRL